MTGEPLLQSGAFGPALEPDSAVPLYRQVRALLEDQLGRGVYAPNRPMPSTRYLSSTLGVSRNTVALAYQELTGLGLVESRPRSGLYPVVLRSAPVERNAEARPPRSSVPWGERAQANRVGAPPRPGIGAPAFPDWQRYPYPFISSQPELRSFPVRAWQRAMNEALSGRHLAYSVRDAADRDDPLLVEVLCNEILPARGVRARPEEVLITSGAQQALSLIAETFLGPDSVVAVENPGYVDAWHICTRAGAAVVPVEVDQWGAVIERAPRFDAVYLTPSHQHPTNVTLSLPRRRLLLEKLAETGAFAIEDDYDSEFRFRGRPTPSLKSLDRDGRVLYLGSFSKFLAAGLRLGYVVGPAEAIAALRAERHHRSKHLPGQLQRALGIFIESGEYHKVLRGQRRRLARNWAALTEAVTRLLPHAETHPVYPPGGVSLWYTAPPEFGCRAWAERAMGRGVLISDGSRYSFPGTIPDRHLRLGFSSIRLEQIRPGIELLAGLMRE